MIIEIGQNLGEVIITTCGFSCVAIMLYLFFRIRK